MLAGVSVDYIVRLEQGRASAPSGQVCAALARALRLSDAEQEHLFRLAGQAQGNGRIGHLVPQSVRRLTERLDDRPIAVYDAMWTLVSWNRLWAALMGDPSEVSERERNVIWRHFTGRHSRTVMTPSQRDEFESTMVADLRRTLARYPDDPEPAALVDELSRVSAEFRRGWDVLEVTEHVQATKSVRHPAVGQLELDCDVLTAQRGDLRIVVYTAAPDSEAETKLALLAAIGTQTMSSSVHNGAE